jgi:co-chaperonin GroES (HSP10)
MATEYTHESLDDAFPAVDPGVIPVGGRVLIQLRQVKKTATGSRIILVAETKDTERHQNMIGKVVGMGALAFKKRDTMEAWPEGAWVGVGDYVRVPRWSGDRFTVQIPKTDAEIYDDEVTFVIMNDHEIWGRVTPENVLKIKAFV